MGNTPQNIVIFLSLASTKSNVIIFLLKKLYGSYKVPHIFSAKHCSVFAYDTFENLTTSIALNNRARLFKASLA